MLGPTTGAGSRGLRTLHQHTGTATQIQPRSSRGMRMRQIDVVLKLLAADGFAGQMPAGLENMALLAELPLGHFVDALSLRGHFGDVVKPTFRATSQMHAIGRECQLPRP